MEIRCLRLSDAWKEAKKEKHFKKQGSVDHIARYTHFPRGGKDGMKL